MCMCMCVCVCGILYRVFKDLFECHYPIFFVAVILDLGDSYIKVGFVGDAKPRMIYRNEHVSYPMKCTD